MLFIKIACVLLCLHAIYKFACTLLSTHTLYKFTCLLLRFHALYILRLHGYSITVRFTKLLTNGFRSSFQIPEVHHELDNFITQSISSPEPPLLLSSGWLKYRGLWERDCYAVVNHIANLRTKR